MDNQSQRINNLANSLGIAGRRIDELLTLANDLVEWDNTTRGLDGKIDWEAFDAIVERARRLSRRNSGE